MTIRKLIKDFFCQKAYTNWESAYWYYAHYFPDSLGWAKGELYERIGDVWMMIAAAFDRRDYMENE